MTVRIGDFEIGNKKSLLLIAGPCVIESWDQVYTTATALKDICKELGINYVFKASFDKANRTSYNSFRGPGLKKGLEMLGEIKSKLGLPVLSDVHEEAQCAAAGEVLDIIQIPAFLCRQTDLVCAAAKTGKTVNIKKGQFVAPLDILHSVNKVKECGNQNVTVTERGTTFGYNNLVVDYRSIPMIQSAGVPLIFDATHSVQLPSAGGGVSGGDRKFIPNLTRAALAAGCDGLFMEIHPNPDQAMSDASTQIPLWQAKDLLKQCVQIYELVKNLPEIKLPDKGQCSQPALIGG
ncbi:MAG: 3-deoxy-8-phosphooctulonate synthase [Candidatus Obscuribacterales bacterium]|nr:3-deoxy-8-phosphooctulonate synthase [Candidatus Obscuribacterales bacterium]